MLKNVKANTYSVTQWGSFANGDSTFINKANATYANDGITSDCSGTTCSFKMQTFDPTDTNIPIDATINSLTATIYYKLGGASFWWYLWDSGGTHDCDSSHSTWSYSAGLTSISHTYDTSCITDLKTKLNTGSLGWYLSGQGGGSYGPLDIDAVKFVISYDNSPVTGTTNWTASSSAGLATFDVDGHTNYISQVNTFCAIDVIKNLTNKYGGPSYDELVPVAQILVDNFNTPARSTTGTLGPGNYLGYGYTKTDDSFHAHGISINYDDNYVYSFKYKIRCYDQNNTTLYSVDTTIDSSLQATPSGQTTQYYENCTSTDLLCSIWNKFQTWFRQMFLPNSVLDTAVVNGMVSKMFTKAPMAYFEAFRATDLTDVSFDATPSFSIPYTVEPGVISNVTFSSSVWSEWNVTPYIDIVKGVIRVMAWGALGLLIFNLGKDVMSS